MNQAEAMFAGIVELATKLADQRQAHKQQLRDARNARRRAQPRRPVRPRPASPAGLDDITHDDACSCHTSPMPPCGWCENGGDADESAF